MNFECLIIFSLITPLHVISAQASSHKQKSLITSEEQVQIRQADSIIGDLRTQIHETRHRHQRSNTDSTKKSRSGRNQFTSRHHQQRNLRDIVRFNIELLQKLTYRPF